MSDFLFTYGTLRMNENPSMTKFLAENTELIGLAVLSKAKIYRIDWYPALINTNNDDDKVVGELVKVIGNDAWLVLDDYEGIGMEESPCEYDRKKIKVLAKGEELECWAYFYKLPLPNDAKWIQSGDFLNP